MLYFMAGDNPAFFASISTFLQHFSLKEIEFFAYFICTILNQYDIMLRTL